MTILPVPVILAGSSHAQTLADLESHPGPGQAIAYCSPTSPGTVVAEIRWPIQHAPLSPSAARSALRAETLSVTTYENGFEQGLSSELTPFQPGARALPSRAERRQPLVGLDRLKLVDTSTSRIAPGSARGRALPAPEAPEFISFMVEGLQPGMRYFWRFNVPGEGQQMVTVQAPVCPVDYVDKKRRR
jgi:hypothetical protein